MKDLAVFLPKIHPHAPDCPEPTAYDAIREAAIEFCERTKLWRFEDEFDVTASGCDAIMAPYGAVIQDIERVDFNGSKLLPRSTEWLDWQVPNWRSSPDTGMPAYFTQTEPGTISLAPRSAGRVHVWMRLKPSQDATDVPDFIADEYRQVIADGALARILLIPGQPFVSPELAGVFGGSFQSRLTSLSAKSITGQQRAPARVRANYF